MPRSLDLPGFVRLSGSSLDCAEMMRPHVPAAHAPGPWLPKVEIGGYDGLVDAADFADWLAASVVGETIAYYCGRNLALDRLHDATLDLLAREVMLASGGSMFRTSRCFHIRGVYRGSREVEVTPRRVPAPEPPMPAEAVEPGALHGAEAWWWLHLCRRLP
jgi:hypothetical protein